ncbi:MAG: hypothetical protein HY756_04030 [Nitrospirae bacterium]|nr:hypothetical protein [Nitrospirota bacterium]
MEDIAEMVWNYRVIEHDRFFAIHEVYYNDKGDITAISEDPMHRRARH